MRKFVILEEQPDYYKKVQGITPKGHMNIEVRDGRGRLTLNVDNLKINPDEEKLYKACLIGLDNKNFVDVDLGVIVLNERGKGSLEWRFDPTSVGGTSLSIERFNNVLVKEVDISNENNDMVVPLSGYIYKKDGSLVKLMKKQAEKEISKKQEIEKQEIEEAQIEEIVANNGEVLEDVEPEEAHEQLKTEEDNIQEDTYIDFEEKASKEEYIEEVEKVEEEIELEEQETRIDSFKENTQEEVQEEIHEEASEERQEEKREEVYEKKTQEEEKSELEKYNIEAKKLEAQELEDEEVKVDEFKPEELGIEDLSIEDIIPLDIEIDKLENQDIEVAEQEQQEQQEQQEHQEQLEEQVDSTRTIWIDLETGEEIQYEEDDIIHNHQVTYNYGDYIENTYGSKINKMDSHMKTVKNYSMQVANYTMDILKFFEKVEPFRENLRDCTWWKIEYNNEDFQRGFLPFYNYLVNAYYPYPLTSKTTTCQSMIEKYGHYIFGTVTKQGEIQYYVYGVPGKFTIAEHPYNGSTGFNTWLKDKNSSEGLGYWLIYVDALSGKIVNPVNPTIPTR